MFETILVPLDGSELGEAALPITIEIKSKFNSRLILLRVLEPASQRLAQPTGLLESPAAAAVNVELAQKMTEAEREAAHSYLTNLLQRLGPGQDIESLVMEGEAASVISQVATEKGAGLIVMSSHGRGGLGRLVFGSVADAVLRESKVPVLLIRAGAQG